VNEPKHEDFYPLQGFHLKPWHHKPSKRSLKLSLGPSELFPDPATPVTTVNTPLGISTLTLRTLQKKLLRFYWNPQR
jgi:hypothetical protein